MEPAIKVEKYTLDDLHGIAEIEKECFTRPWSYESFCMEYADKNKFYFVVRDDDGKVIGYGGYAHILEHVFPLMKNYGYTQEEIDCLMIENPKRIFSIQK